MTVLRRMSAGYLMTPVAPFLPPFGLLMIATLIFISCCAFMQKKRFRMLTYCTGAIILLLRWWWLFSGIYLQCPAI